jgi:hypothetical protein
MSEVPNTICARRTPLIRPSATFSRREKEINASSSSFSLWEKVREARMRGVRLA